MINPRERAQFALALLKEAIVQELEVSDKALSNADIVHRLNIPSEFEGQHPNYLSWSVLGLLIKDGKVKIQGEGRNRVFYVRQDQL